MITLIDAEKAFNKIQLPFMIKMLQNLDIEGTYLNIIKAIYIYNKPTANIILTGENLKVFPLRSEQEMVPTLTTIIQQSFGSPSYGNQRRKRIKIIPIGKEVKLSLLDTRHRKPQRYYLKSTRANQ